MLLSELINKLQILQSRVGDTKVSFSVRDHFSKYGEQAEFDLKVGDTTGLPTDFNASFTADGWTNFELNLKVNGTKRPKITYR